MKIVRRVQKIALGAVATLATLTGLGLNHTAAAADVGVSIRIGQPGFFGQLDIGDYYPAPELIYRQPVYVRPVRGVIVDPVYLHVPPGHARRWSRYCDRYDACGRPVYFVRDGWYDRVYVPAYRERHRDDYRYYDRGEWRHGERGRDDERGRGYGRGHDRD